jgi:hypothetical protein
MGGRAAGGQVHQPAVAVDRLKMKVTQGGERGRCRAACSDTSPPGGRRLSQRSDESGSSVGSGPVLP